MKHLILIIMLLLTVGALDLCLAASDDATVTVNVIEALNVSKEADLDFGDQEVGVGNVSIASTDASAGKFSVSGANGVDVDCSFPSTVTLTSGGNNLTFTANTPIHNTADNQGGAVAFGGATGGTTALSGTGELYIWFGGSVNIDGSVNTGTYSGTYTATVVYN